ncbi:MAG: GNAT family N-acetyltransferase [Thermoguttaceae bacterium]
MSTRMTTEDNSTSLCGYRVAAVGNDDLPTLLAFLVSSFDHNERQNRVAPILESLRLGLLDCSGSCAVWLGETIVGGLFAQRQGDDLILITPPLTVAPDVLPLIAQTFGEFCKTQRIPMAVMMSEDVDDTETPRQMGFRIVSPLVSMACDEVSFPLAPPTLAATLRPVVTHRATPNEERLAVAKVIEIAERTYEDSLDFPDILGPCRAKTVIEGYRLAPGHDLQLWYTVHRNSTLHRNNTANDFEDEACGVLLLCDHPRENGLEIVYVGLEKSSRGCGLGRGLVEWTQWFARQNDRRWVFVAVDSANVPAVRVYNRTGFEQYQQKLLSIRET